VGVFNSNLFLGLFIQSFLIHFNFLISDRGHGSFLGDVLAQKTVVILIASTLPAGKWSGKVGGALKLFINMCMRCKLFAFVKGQRLDPCSLRLELVHNGLAIINSVFLLVTLSLTPYPLLRSTTVTTAPLLAGANHGIAFPMTYLPSGFNIQWAIAQRPSVGDLSLAVSSTSIAFPLLLLNAQVLPKNSTQSLVRINTLKNSFMADGQLRGNLLRTPLNAQQRTGFFPYPLLNSWSFATVLCTLDRYLTGLLGSITPRASMTNKLPTDGGLVTSQQFGYFRMIKSVFYKGVNLISFGLAEVFVGHGQLCLAGQEALNAKYPQPPDHQLIKVALRT